MTRSSGRYRPALRAIALLLIVTGWGVPLAFPHAAEDDLLCAVGEAAGAGESAKFVQPTLVTPNEHCDVCHALRTFRHAGLPATIASVHVSSARPLQLEATASSGREGVTQLPARAPPLHTA